MTQLNKRKEILFLYDVTNNNPNGDPDNENQPRLDEETEKLRVTDVRLKRTVRDYMDQFLKKGVFVKEYHDEKGKMINKDKLLEQHNIKTLKDMLNKFIDIRLFGSTTAVEKKTITLTGPVQFKMGVSINQVQIENIKGTTVFSSGKGTESKGQGTFTDKWITPYALINFYGLVNENAGKDSDLQDEDISILLKAMWEGTKILSSCSKAGHMPRVILEITYKEKGLFHIGELDKHIELKTTLSNEKAIRSTDDYVLDFSKLTNQIEKYKDKIDSISLKVDDSLKTENIGFNYKDLIF
jgi:CRISPR-associated protein Csh2